MILGGIRARTERGEKVVHWAKAAGYLVFTASYVYLLWIVLHYVAAHLYARYCTPLTIMGFIISPFIITAPHCKGLRWVLYNGATMIETMWVVFGTWLCSKIIVNSST